MLILTIHTDKPEAELGLYDSQKRLAYYTWQAHRQLAETIHPKIKQILEQHQQSLNDMRGIVVYKGPGSFTGLRIGFSVANALADSLKIPIISRGGEAWLQKAINDIENGDNENLVLPEYGSPPHTTSPKH